MESSLLQGSVELHPDLLISKKKGGGVWLKLTVNTHNSIASNTKTWHQEPAGPFLDSTLREIPQLSFSIKCIDKFILSSDRNLEPSADWNRSLMLGSSCCISCNIALSLWYHISTLSSLLSSGEIWLQFRQYFISVLKKDFPQCAEATSVDDSAV